MTVNSKLFPFHQVKALHKAWIKTLALCFKSTKSCWLGRCPIKIFSRKVQGVKLIPAACMKALFQEVLMNIILDCLASAGLNTSFRANTFVTAKSFMRCVWESRIVSESVLTRTIHRCVFVKKPQFSCVHVAQK